MSKIKYNDDYSYEIFDNGYDIFNHDIKIIEQRDPYGKVFDITKSYEENCLIQLDQMNLPQPGPYDPTKDPIAVNAANIDYLSMMTGIDLPA